MFSVNFDRAFNIVLASEGELSLDPDDPGNWTKGAKGKGELVGTKYGISAAQYPQIDIQGLTREGAKNIYWRDYWKPNYCDDFPVQLAIAYFDACVNQGPAQATIALQRALGGDLKADGKMGPLTRAAARGCDQYEVVPRFLAERAWIYSGTKNFQKYGRGWFNRLFHVGRDVHGMR